MLVEILTRCERLGVDVSIVPRLYEKLPRRLTVAHMGGLALLTIHPSRPNGLAFFVKHVFDRLLSCLMLLVLAPVMITLAVVIRARMGSPVLYRQPRVGRDGRTFTLLKFRSMRPGDPDDQDGDGARTPPLGRFLRRSSLDELPQLLNVARGNMSLVGPRPERPELVDRFTTTIHRYRERERVKSGITGWAQVHGIGRRDDRFSDESLAARAEWDNYYIENWSPWLDLKIALLTMLAVVRFRQS